MIDLNTQPKQKNSRPGHLPWGSISRPILVVVIGIIFELVAISGWLHFPNGNVQNAVAASEVTISINDATVYEPASGTATANFTVSLSSASLNTVTVYYYTADGTAKAVTDYNFLRNSLSFSPGVTQKTIYVTVLAASRRAGELPTRDFGVRLYNPVGVTIADDTGMGTIISR
jgi:hypothetical protein